MPLAKFCGTDSYIFAEFFVEVIYVFITYLFGNFIHFQIVLHKKLFRTVNTLMIHIGIETFPHTLCENFAKIGTVITKEGSDGLQFDIFLKMMINVKDDIVEDRVFGGISQDSHDSFKLL